MTAFSLFMPSYYNSCVSLSVNHYRENLKLSFNRISEDKCLRKEYTN